VIPGTLVVKIGPDICTAGKSKKNKDKERYISSILDRGSCHWFNSVWL